MTSATYRSFTGSGAENYQRFFVPAIATPASVDLLRNADLSIGERVLDVACGTGVIARLAALLVAPAGSVAGIDISPEMIEVAQSLPETTDTSIEWHLGDATELPMPSGSFDVAVCQMGLMFMDDPPVALREMRRVLRPGGRLVVNTPGAIQPPFEVMEEAIIDHISPQLGGFVRAVFAMHDPDQLDLLLREAGFEAVSATTSTTELQLPTPAEFLWQYINLTPMGPFVAGASEDAQQAMERQVVERSQQFTIDGRLVVSQPMVVASGRG